MDTAGYSFQRLNADAAPIIAELFVSVFSKSPWNDDWSDKNQLNLYIDDLIG